MHGAVEVGQVGDDDAAHVPTASRTVVRDRLPTRAVSSTSTPVTVATSSTPKAVGQAVSAARAWCSDSTQPSSRTAPSSDAASSSTRGRRQARRCEVEPGTSSHRPGVASTQNDA